MQNVKGLPWSKYNLNRTDTIQETIDKTEPDIFAIMEFGVHNNNTANMPLNFNKKLQNNIKEDENKHITPNGAGTLIWTNEKIIIKKAINEINNQKTQKLAKLD